MDESASAPTDGPHRGLGGGLLHLAMRPKAHGAVQTGGGGRGESIVSSNQPKDNDDTDNAAPLPVVTRRRNGQQVRHLMLPPSHYAPVAPPPIAMFATGGQDAAGTADDANYDDDDDADAHIDQEIAALRSLARARASSRTQRIVRRPQHHIRNSSSSGGGNGGGGSSSSSSSSSIARDRVSLSFLLPSAVAGGASPSSLLLSPSDRALAMRAHAFPSLERSPPPVAAAVFPNNRTLAGRVGKPEVGGRFRRPVLMRQHRPPAVAATTTTTAASRSGAGAAIVTSLLRRPPRHSSSSSSTAPVAAEPMLVLATILALPGFDFAFREWSLGAAVAAAVAAERAADFEKLAVAEADLALIFTATQLALSVLSHPAVVRRCGRSPHRRGVARFLVYLLTFPFVTPHGKAAFEAACGGYTPGDEARPAFWAQYAVGFAMWLGLIDSNGDGGSSGSSDPFLGGVVLRTLVMRLSEARMRFLAQKANDADTESNPETIITGDKDMSEAMGVDADADADSNGTAIVSSSAAAAAAVSSASDLSAQVAKLRLDRRNAQNLPVSKAVDAWLLFVARRHDEDIDPALLAELRLD